MTRLSVNINKVATIRNARGGNMPDVGKAAIDCDGPADFRGQIFATRNGSLSGHTQCIFNN